LYVTELVRMKPRFAS